MILSLARVRRGNRAVLSRLHRQRALLAREGALDWAVFRRTLEALQRWLGRLERFNPTPPLNSRVDVLKTLRAMAASSRDAVDRYIRWITSCISPFQGKEDRVMKGPAGELLAALSAVFRAFARVEEDLFEESEYDASLRSVDAPRESGQPDFHRRAGELVLSELSFREGLLVGQRAERLCARRFRSQTRRLSPRDSEIGNLLFELADEEDRHLELLSRLEARVAWPPVWKLDEYRIEDVLRERFPTLMKGRGDPGGLRSILRGEVAAIEEESMKFYQDLLLIAPDEESRETVRGLIEREAAHRDAIA